MIIDRELIVIYADRIKDIVDNCEEIQASDECEGRKRQAISSAYEEIRDLIRSGY